jgi:dynein intermediate chain 1
LDENPNFISISSDGRVTQWTLLKTELDYTDVIQLRLDGRTGPLDKDAVKPEPAVFDMSSGACIDFKKTNPDIFLVGTEEGQIHKCSKAYNSQFMLSFEVCSRLLLLLFLGSSNGRVRRQVQPVRAQHFSFG